MNLKPKANPKPAPKPKLQRLIKSKNKIALIDGGAVVEFIILPKDRFCAGTVLVGRIESAAPVPNAYFVTLPEHQVGFLQSTKRLDIGAKVLTVVSKEAHGKKYAKLTTTLPSASFSDEQKKLFKEAFTHAAKPLVLFVPDIIRELQSTYDIGEIVTDDMPRKTDIFASEGLQDVLADALSPLVTTKEGVRLFVEKTEAFWAIDVDSGAAADITLTEINLIAAKEIARQIRLKNLSGQIVIDFISSPKNRLSGEVVAALKQAVKTDPTPTLVAGVTPLGHVEVVRRGRRQSLMESAKALDEK